jgi:hypothetical protein
VRITCRATVPATETQMVASIQQVLDRRGSMNHPPVSIAINDAVALGIASLFTSPIESGQVMERLYRGGEVDSGELLEAIRFEQGYASAEGHAALHCLAGWVAAKVHRPDVR